MLEPASQASGGALTLLLILSQSRAGIVARVRQVSVHRHIVAVVQRPGSSVLRVAVVHTVFWDPVDGAGATLRQIPASHLVRVERKVKQAIVAVLSQPDSHRITTTDPVVRHTTKRLA